MKTLLGRPRNLFRILLALLLLPLTFGPAPWVQAQDIAQTAVIRILDSDPAAKVMGAISTETPLLVRYIGTAVNGGTVTVAAGGDITFKTGPVGSSTAGTTFECPVSGALGGIIDVSDTACDTLGEVADVINASSDWRAVILDGKRSDSSDDTLITLAETAAGTQRGVGLLHDGVVSFKATMALTPERNFDAFIESNGRTPSTLVADPYKGRRACLEIANATTTYGSGTSTFEVSSIKVVNSTVTGVASETVTNLYSAPAGATTVNQAFDFTPYGICANKGEKLLVRINNSAAMSAALFRAYGFSYRYK